MELACIKMSASTEQSIGEFGNYLILRPIGRGGNAHVYLAEHLYLKTRVAVKLLNLSLANSDEIKHFLFEAQLHAHLRHQHIIQVLDFGWKNGTPFMVMEHASRGTLKHALPQGVPLPLSMILPFVVQAASALHMYTTKKLSIVMSSLTTCCWVPRTTSCLVTLESQQLWRTRNHTLMTSCKERSNICRPNKSMANPN